MRGRLTKKITQFSIVSNIPVKNLSMGICRLCLEEGDLVDSHIIPKAFHRDLKGKATGAPIIIGTSSTTFPKRSPGGIYEEEMLCRPCEERFGPWDDYGTRCLIRDYKRDAQPMSFNGATLAYQFSSWIEDKLRMFALSLLWRAAATTNEMFKKVTIGPHLERLTKRILAADPGSAEDFSVMIVRWSTNPEYDVFRKSQMSPYAVRLLGVNEVKMFMGGFIVHVKVDKRPYPSPLSEIILRPGRPVYMLERQLEGSKDILALKPAIEQFTAGAAAKVAKGR